jgi:hypothetical protein
VRRRSTDSALTHSEADGGMFALVGFIQQMLGTAEDYVRYVSGLETTGPARFENIIVETEALGQDTAMTGVTRKGNRVRTLTQYKFSHTPDDHPIYPKQLREIAKKLKTSAQRAKHSGARTTLVLRSNRRMSPGAAVCIRTLGIKYEPYDPTEARSALSKYALEFGTYRRKELTRGVRNVIGYLQNVAAGPEPHTIAKNAFERELTDCDNPRSIAIGRADSRFRKELERKASRAIDVKGSALVFRKGVEDAMKEWDYDALIVVTGKEGVAKRQHFSKY